MNTCIAAGQRYRVPPRVTNGTLSPKLMHVKADQAMGPDSIPPGIIKKFGYQLAMNL